MNLPVGSADVFGPSVEAVRGPSGEERKGPDYRWVLLTPPGQGFYWHQDAFRTTAWNLHLGGAPKRWFFREPSQKRRLRGHAAAPSLGAVQRAGDAILIPSGWWHRTWTRRLRGGGALSATCGRWATARWRIGSRARGDEALPTTQSKARS